MIPSIHLFSSSSLLFFFATKSKFKKFHMGEEKKEEAGTSGDAGGGSGALPAGVVPFFCSDSHADKLGMKTGKGIVDLVDMKSFDKELYLKEIADLGFMCPFEPVEKQLKECPLEEFVVVTDVESKHGEMFLLYYGGEAISKLRDEKAAAEAAKQAMEAKLAAEAEEKRLAEEARKNAVYVDEPMKSRLYVSDTAVSTQRYLYTTDRERTLHLDAAAAILFLFTVPHNWSNALSFHHRSPLYLKLSAGGNSR